MVNTVDHAYFTRKMFLRSVLPAPLAGIGLALAEMGDTILVGHALGMDGMAAIGFTTPMFLVATFFVFGLSMGGAIVYANLTHEGKQEEALGVFNFFLRLAAVIGFGITIGGLAWGDGLLHALGVDPRDGVVYELTRSYLFYILLGIPFEILMEVLCAYIRNDDADTFSIAVQTAAGAGNIVISALLLFWFDWGIAGCSFGFFFSNLAAVLASIAYILLRSGGELSICSKSIPFRDSVKPLRLGFATSAEYVFDAVFTLAVIHILADMVGTEGVGIFNIIENLSLLFIFMYEFIGKTSQPIFSTFYAECNFAELHRALRYALVYSLLMGVLATSLVAVYPEILGVLFGLDDVQDISKVYYATRVFCVSTIFMGVCLLLQNYLQSEEDERSAFLVVFMRRIGVSLPLAFLLEPFGFYTFWLVYPLAEIITLIVLFIYKRSRGEAKRIASERVFAASFAGQIEDVAAQLDAMEDFAASWGADSRRRHALRLAVTDAVSAESAAGEPVLTQLTLIAHEGGTFELHLRMSGDKHGAATRAEQASPLRESYDFERVAYAQQEQHPLKLLRKSEEADANQSHHAPASALAHPCASADANQSHHAPAPALAHPCASADENRFIYRNYHGFNTVMITV